MSLSASLAVIGLPTFAPSTPSSTSRFTTMTFGVSASAPVVSSRPAKDGAALAPSSSPPRNSQSPPTPSCPCRTCPHRSQWPEDTCSGHPQQACGTPSSPSHMSVQGPFALSPRAHCHFSSSTSASGSSRLAARPLPNLRLGLGQRHLARLVNVRHGDFKTQRIRGLRRIDRH